MVFVPIIVSIAILAICAGIIYVGIINVKEKNSAFGFAMMFFGFLPLLALASVFMNYYLKIEDAMFKLLMPIAFGFAILIIFRNKILPQ